MIKRILKGWTVGVLWVIIAGNLRNIPQLVLGFGVQYYLIKEIKDHNTTTRKTGGVFGYIPIYMLQVGLGRQK